ncbi:Palmitoyl-acyl carrier protein thioesterase chloroplastic [Euphorbia peplus]|nr:Palmitoyl-acyl carrier protein thioesterase chloroplastic [Euphorbia peplus]
MAASCGSLIFNKDFQVNFEKKNDIKNLPSPFSKIPNKKNNFEKINDFGAGRLVENGLVYCQNLMIKSFEIGFDRKASISTLISYLQDSAINHGRITGIMADTQVLGVTQEMSRHDLIWVLSSLQIVVDQYPSWLDVVQLETWMYPLGKNGLGHDWIIRDSNTDHVLAQATSQFVLMNKKTRKLSKFRDEIRQELAPHMVEHSTLILDSIIQKPPQLNANTSDFSSAELKPGWSDLDANLHVNNVKYINWILESVPQSLMKHHKLSAMSLKFRKECDMDSVLQSLSKIITTNENNEIELEHLLVLQNGQQIVKGNTLWKLINDIN